MSIKEDLAKLGIKKGSKVKGLFQQTLKDSFDGVYDDIETITNIITSEENPDALIIKTTEMTERETYSVNGKDINIPPEAREYEVIGLDMLHLHDADAPTQFKLKEQGLEVRLTPSSIETEFSTIPKDLLQSLVPFINYVKANSDELEEEIDVDTIGLASDGVVYPVNVLLELAKNV